MDQAEFTLKYRTAHDLLQQGSLREALALLDEINAASPHNSDVVYSRAQCLARLGNVSEAGRLCDYLSVVLSDPRGAQLKQELDRDLFRSQETPPPLPGTVAPAVQAPVSDQRKMKRRGPVRRFFQAFTGAMAAIFMLPRRVLGAPKAGDQAAARVGDKGAAEGGKAAGKAAGRNALRGLLKAAAVALMATVMVFVGHQWWQKPRAAALAERTVDLSSLKQPFSLLTRDAGSLDPAGWAPIQPTGSSVTVPAGKELMLRIGDNGKGWEHAVPPNLNLSAFQAVDLTQSGFNDADLERFAALDTVSGVYAGGTAAYGHGTWITDAGLKRLAAMRSLRALELSGSSSDITAAGLSALSALPQLEELGLSSTGVTDKGLEHLASLRNLKRIDLSFTAVTDKGMAHLARLKKLEKISLDQTPLTDEGVRTLARLPKLRVIDLSNTAVSDAGAKTLAKVTSLRNVNLSHTKITDAGLAALGQLKGLRRLDLAGNRVTDSGMEQLAGLAEVRWLVLSGTGVTNAGLARLKGLPNLSTLILGQDVTQLSVTDSAIEEIQAIKTLKELDVRGAHMTEDGVNRLKAAMPQCKIEAGYAFDRPNSRILNFPQDRALGSVFTTKAGGEADGNWRHLRAARGAVSAGDDEALRLDGNAETATDLSPVLTAGLGDLATLNLPGYSFDGASPVGLEKLTALKSLGLAYATVPDALLSRLEQMPTLRELDLTQTGTTDANLGAIGSLSWLEVLWLGDNKVSDAGPDRLTTPTKLKTLDLAGNPITDAGLASLRKMSSLENLYLERTQVSPDAAVALQQALPDCVITYTIPFTPEPRQTPGARTLAFPENRSFGTLSARPWNSDKAWKPLGEARGKVEIPEGRSVKLAMPEDGAESIPAVAAMGANGPDALDLRGTTVTDNDLPKLEGLSSLYALYLCDARYGHGTQITDEGLQSLAKLPGLRSLTATGYRAAYGPKAPRNLSGLQQLEEMDLSGSSARNADLAMLRSLPNLQRLSLANTAGSRGEYVRERRQPTQLSDAGLIHCRGLSGLRSLDLSCVPTGGVGLGYLRSVSSLETLNLPQAKGMSPEGLAQLAKWPSLRTLDLSNQEVTVEALLAIGQAQALQELGLFKCGVTDEALFNIKGFPSLKKVNLAGNEILGRGLAKLKELPALESLNLERTTVNDAAMSVLKDFPALRDLSIEGTSVSAAGIERLAEIRTLEKLNMGFLRLGESEDGGLSALVKLPNLQELIAPYNDFSTKHAAVIATCVSLRSLTIGPGALDDTALAELRQLTNLRKLDLHYNKKITDAGLAHLSSLTSLEELSLADNGIGSAGLSALKNMKSLRVLNLEDAGQVDDEGLPHLEALASLQRLNLKGTSVTAEGLTELKKKLPDCEIEQSQPPAASAKRRSTPTAAPPTVSSKSATDKGKSQEKAESPAAPGAPGARTLVFPENEIFGTVRVRNWGSTDVQDWGPLGDAMGKVSVPAGKEVRLMCVSDDLTFLDALRPNDLQALALQGAKITDEAVPHIKRLTGLQSLALTGTRISDSGLAELKQALPNCVIVR